MADRGDWIVPTFNGQLRTDKPPLHYFFMRLSYQVFGDGAYGARFFSAIFGTCTVLLTFIFIRTFVSEKAAGYGVFSLLSSLGFVTQFHLAVPDPYLIFFISSAIICYFYYEQEYGRKYLFLAYISVGLGVLTKGPIAIVLPGMAVFFYMLAKRKLNFRNILMLNPPIGIIIIMIIAGPWYYLVHVETNGAWTEGFFLDHNVSRFNAPKEGHSGGFWLPTLYALLMTLPFSIFLPQAIFQAIKKKTDVHLFALITMACMIFFFSLASTKLPGYTSPIFPFVALLLGSYLASIDKKRVGAVISILIYALIAFGLFIGIRYAIMDAKEIRHLTHLQWYFIVLPIAATISLGLLFKKKYSSSIKAIGIGFLILHQVFFYFIYPEVNRQNPVIKTFDQVKQEPNRIAFHRLNAGFVHALDTEIPILYEVSEVEQYLREQNTALVFTRPEYYPLIEHLKLEEIAREPDLFDGTTTLILKK
jgi:4-amino-4-deoxy-L-arabinose transferase-like glycosyltransferase